MAAPDETARERTARVPSAVKDDIIWLLRDDIRTLRRGAWIGMTLTLLIGVGLGFGLRSFL